MSNGDEGAKKPAAPPRPKTPGAAPPRPAAVAPAKPPPPVPTAAKPPPPPKPTPENPFLAPESSREIDAGWGADDDTAEPLSLAPDEAVSVAPEEPPAPEPSPSPSPSPPPPPIATSEPVAQAEPTAQAEPIAQASAPEPVPTSTAKPAPSTGESKPATPSLPPFQKKSRGKAIAFVIGAALVLGIGGFVVHSQMKPPPVERPPPEIKVETPPPPPPAPEPPPPPTAALEPPASASASASAKPKLAGGGVAPVLSADPAKTGVLDTTPLPPGRKIIVDGQFVGTSPRRVNVRCGVRRVQIGDLPPEAIQFPCGGEVTFTD